MKRLNLGISIGLCVLLLGSLGCATTSQHSQAIESQNYTSYWTLEDFLRRANGVQLNGSGDNIQVIIRGHKSINNPMSQPLFVVDGQKAGRNYSRVSSMFSPGDINSVKVLPPGSSAQYGMQGQYGVIEIESTYSGNQNS
ncbi:Plug domain-containing protein [Fodinibius sp.]|uniref:Plug domain-containing protein n=1 Tax=Fodinibius sp. TaxID=1872440 RepID=UPI002ACD39F2|nr:Plug domain-containing protein [Fodinibius sp.]MDZ7659051.1 Plug domain-containing protein [Fodinibius sp.]